MKILQRASAVLIAAATLPLYAARSVDEIRITRRQQPEIRNCDPGKMLAVQRTFSVIVCAGENSNHFHRFMFQTL